MTTNKKIDLALAFLEAQPVAAVIILEQQPMEDVAHFLNDIPYTYVAPILEKMLPQYTAKLCVLLDLELSVGVLSQMDMSLSAAILRHSKPDLRKKILSLFPEKTKIACKLLLSYSGDAVGAWMETQVATLPDDCNVGEALKRITLDEPIVNQDLLYVVNRDRKLRGAVSSTTLLQTSPELSIVSVMEKNLDALYGRSSLFSIKNHEGWMHHDTLPVLNRQNQLVGILRYLDLRKGLDQMATTIEAPKGSDTITNICEAYGGSLLALFDTIGEMVSTKK